MNKTHAHQRPAAIPHGFEATPMGGPFIAANGPLYVSTQGERIRLGMPIDERHVNSIATVHGGMLATFGDMLMPMVFYRHPDVVATGRAAPTISLHIDYIGLARLGDWLEGTGEVIKVTRSLVFAQGLIFANGKPVARCSGVYKFGPSFTSGQGMYTDGTETPQPIP
jgi:uncharacterized protein (TIGR00369 family)